MRKKPESKELTKEEMADEIQKGKEKMQDDFIDKLNQDVDWLIEKTMKSSYRPTSYERTIFNQIRQKLENMNKWF